MYIVLLFIVQHNISPKCVKEVALLWNYVGVMCTMDCPDVLFLIQLLYMLDFVSVKKVLCIPFVAESAQIIVH